MTNRPGSQRIGFIDNPHTPQLYVDAASGFFLDSGNLRITLESLRMNHVSSPGPVNRVVIGRIVIPVERAEALAREILEFLEQEKTEQPAQTKRGATLQ